MVPTALDTNEGNEVKCVVEALSTYYSIDGRVVACWDAPSAQSRIMPQDEGVQWTIELPAVRHNTVEEPPPVREITAQIEDATAHADMLRHDGPTH